jgi:hypothetical protein
MKSVSKHVLAIGTVLALVLIAFTTLPMNVGAATSEPPTVEWVGIYTGPGARSDFGQAIVVDQLGNVYVTGYSYGSGTSNDYATVKYDKNGNELWAKRYNGPGNKYDSGKDIAVDPSGNVYVTGQCTGIGTLYDYATIKYDKNGNELWVKRYCGPGNKNDVAQAISVDSSGNVYVTGNSWASNVVRQTDGTYIGDGYDAVTIKYDTNGNQLWLVKYDGPHPALNRYKNDWGYDLTLDSLGNVYITGASSGIVLGQTANDYVTVKYNSAGTELWVARYDAAGGTDAAYSIALDAAGNVYVHGDSDDKDGTSIDLGTVKYNSLGVQQWAARYDGPAHERERARRNTLAIDTAGNVIVAGVSEGIGTSNDFAAVKYDSAGNQKWAARKDFHGKSDYQTTLSIDACGNAYLSGKIRHEPYTEQRYNIGTVKFDGSSGTEVWAVEYDGPAHKTESGKNIAVDLCGNVYVTGASTGINTGYDYVTVKYYQGQGVALENLICLVKSLNLQEGIEDSLVMKLENALKSIEKDNNIAAKYQLNAFNYEVSAQKGKALTDTQADILTRCANCLIAKLQ